MKKTQKFTNMIQLNAESIGIKSLDNEIIDYLNVEIEEKIKLILSQAQKFIRISKKKTLKVDDLGHSLKLYNIEEPIGYDSYSMTDYEKIENVKGLWKMKQNVIDIEDYLTKPMAIYPMQPFPHFYWFAIEGKRPNIPENFIRNENQNIEINKIEKEHLTNNESKEITNNEESMNKINEESNNENNYQNEIKVEEPKKEQKKINHVIHNISKELQIFFENFKQRFQNEINANVNNHYLYLSKDMQMSINIIKTNPGIVELVPYIINFLMTTFENYSFDVKICHCILHFINSIINNKSFFLEPYLHQILIILISLILFENDKNKIIYLDPIIRLKFYAVKILEQIILTYSIKYHELQFQLVQIFMDNINFKDKENTNYLRILGAIEGLKMIGPIFTKKVFEKVGIIPKENINENFKIFIEECQNDKEMNIFLKNINFKKDFNENELKTINENPKFSNIDSFYKNDFNKRKKLALFFCFQNALNLIKDIKIINN
jgi:transcription initiation factor TFIID subunit 6